MILNRILSGLRFSLLAFATLLPVGHTFAGTVSVTQSKCEAEITLQANDALLSEIFRELATELGFDLLFDRGSDRNVTVDSTRAADKLIESLTREDNVMITTADDPRCAGQKRITEVRFLGAGDPIFFPAHVSKMAAPMPAIKARKARARMLKLDKEDIKKRRDMTPEERQLDRQRQRQGRKR